MDHIFTSIREASGFILESDVSDHFAVGLSTDKKSKSNPKSLETCSPLQDPRSLAYLKDYLSCTDWQPVLGNDTTAAGL
jgi:hypothetical protein